MPPHSRGSDDDDGNRAPPRPARSGWRWGGAAEHVPGADVPGAHGVADGVRRRGRRHHVQHRGVPEGGGAPVAVLGLGRRHAVRSRGQVAHGALQPHQPLHALPARRRRHPRLPEHRRVAGDRAAAVVRAGQGPRRRSLHEPDRRVEPDGRGDHGQQRQHRRAGRDVVVQVQVREAQVHARVPDRADALGHHLHLQRHPAQLPGLAHPPGVQPQHRRLRRHHPGPHQVAQHGRHQPGLVLAGAHRGLLRGVRRRLRGHQERVGRVRHRRGDAQRAHRGAAPHLRVPHQRGHRAGERDVGRDRRREGGGHHGGGHGVGGADQDGGGARRVRAGRVRAADDAGGDEAGVLDDGGLQVAPRRQVRHDGGARGGEHQLPGRGGHRGVEGGGEDGGHPGRSIQGDMHGQRHRRDDQAQEGVVELRRRGGRVVGGRHPGAVRGAAGRARRRMPVPDRHAGHRQGHRAAVLLLPPSCGIPCCCCCCCCKLV